MPVAKGQWVDVEGDERLYVERMIPVRIACSDEDLSKIIDMTIEYYDQIAVMAYLVSDEVIIRRRK